MSEIRQWWGKAASGHCSDIDGNLRHEPGTCCNGQCCGYADIKVVTGPDSEGVQAPFGGDGAGDGYHEGPWHLTVPESPPEAEPSSPVVPSAAAVPVEVPADLLQAVAKAIAETDDENGCFDRVAEYDALTGAEREDFDSAHGYPHGDFEDCEYYRRRAAAAYPLIAARVRAETIAQGQAELLAYADDLANAGTSAGLVGAHRLAASILGRLADGDALADHDARVRAEERQRIAALIRENAGVSDSFARDGSPAGLIAYLINDVMGRAGAAVPVATPGPTVEIGGVVMTQRQFDAARFPLIHGGAAPALSDDVMSVKFGPVATPRGRTAHDATVAAQALMGVVAEIDDLPTAELVTRRAMQFEQEAQDLASMPATPSEPVDEVVCPNCEQTIRARMSDAPADQDSQATVALTRDGLDGGWVAVLSAPPGCMSQGETIPAALRNLAGAAAEVAEVAAALALAEQDGQR